MLIMSKKIIIVTYNFSCMNKRKEEFHIFLIRSYKTKIYIHSFTLMFTKTIKGPLLQVFFKEGGGGEATLPLSIKKFLISICQISQKIDKKFFLGLYFQLNLCTLTLLSTQNAPNFNIDRILRVYLDLYPSDQKKKLPKVLFPFSWYFLDLYAHIYQHTDTKLFMKLFSHILAQ